MEYYNSYHTVSEFLKQGQGRLLVDRERLAKDRKVQRKSRILQLLQLAKEKQVSIEERAPRELQGLLKHYRGYILAVEPELRGKASSVRAVLRERPPLVLLLAGIMDMGNLGAILRSADLFGAGAVFVPHRRGRGNQLGRAAAGANIWVPVIEGNLARIAGQLRENGYWLYAADPSGQEAHQVVFQGLCALVLGAENRGINAQLGQLCDMPVRIPTGGHLDSLNVSAAAAVLMYEIRRQWHA